MSNNSKGVYQGSSIDSEPSLFKEFYPFFEQHIKDVEEALKKVSSLGFFGHLGVDAMIYLDESGKVCLCSILEINARQTMGLASLSIQKHLFPQKRLSVKIGDSSLSGIPLLPSRIYDSHGKEKLFKYNLYAVEECR